MLVVAGLVLVKTAIGKYRSDIMSVIEYSVFDNYSYYDLNEKLQEAHIIATRMLEDFARLFTAYNTIPSWRRRRRMLKALIKLCEWIKSDEIDVRDKARGR